MSQPAYRSRRHRPWYRKITRTHIGWGLVALLAAVLVVFAWQAVRANSALRLAGNQAQVLQNQIVAGDDVAAKTTMDALADSAQRAKGATDGVLWNLGAMVPVVGKNLSAVQDVSVAIDTIAREALPPVVNLSEEINLNTYSPRKGKVDIKAIEKIGPSVSDASVAIAKANERIRGINAEALLAPLRGPVSSIQAKVSDATSASESATLAAELLPSMLGRDETRRYLLLIQSNAEIRATGGISGSYAILTAKKGRLSMGLQGAIQDLRPFTEPVIPMTKDEKNNFSSALVTDLRNANITPDFPRTAQITRAMVKKGLGEDVDGVISVDPVALSFILDGTGPVKLKQGASLNQENAVEVLLSAIYRFYPDSERQNDTFEDAARKIFNVVKSGRGEARLVIAGMVKGVSENRIMVWSSHEAEQELIAPSDLSGRFLGDDGSTPRVGVFLGDAAATKMGYYLDYSTRVTATRCLDDDVQELVSTTQLTSNAPADAEDLPESVTGSGQDTPKGTIRVALRLYSPSGGGFTEVRLNNKKQTVYGDTFKGRNVTRVVVQLRPGETAVVTTAMISGPDQPGDVVLSSTPGIRSQRNDIVTPSACK